MKQKQTRVEPLTSLSALGRLWSPYFPVWWHFVHFPECRRRSDRHWEHAVKHRRQAFISLSNPNPNHVSFFNKTAVVDWGSVGLQPQQLKTDQRFVDTWKCLLSGSLWQTHGLRKHRTTSSTQEPLHRLHGSCLHDSFLRMIGCFFNCSRTFNEWHGF